MAGRVKHLWLSGLTVEEVSVVISAMALPLFSDVPSPAGRHNIDLIMGHAGCVSPWLAAAVATQNVQQTYFAQLAISGNNGNGILLIQAVTPAKLFSSQKDINIQVQGGNITTLSTEDTYISSGKKLVVTAQDELTLICRGGYIKVKGGNVEIGGPGKLLIKNTGIKKAGSGSMQGVMKSFEPSTFDEKFRLTHSLTQEP